jgi:hypothetical protein
VYGRDNIPTNPNLTAADIAKLPYSPAELLASALALEATHTIRPTAPSKVKNASLGSTEATTVMEQNTGVARFLEPLANSRSGGRYVTWGNEAALLRWSASIGCMIS